jgi:imidazolonepropionase-like amidohydrolase
MVDGPIPVWPFALRAGTSEEGRQAVVAIAEAGMDFAKVYTLLPQEALFAIADAANEWGLPFAGHVPIAATAAEASDAGQRSVEHYSDSMLPYCSTDEEAVLADLRVAAQGPEPVQTYAAAFFTALPRMLETFSPDKAAALAERFAANKTRFTPTLLIGSNAARAGEPELLADPRLRYLPSEVTAGWIPQGDAAPVEGTGVDPAIAGWSLEVGAEITRAMQRAGAPVLAGTDLGLPYVLPGFSLHDELALLVESGLSPLEALQAATRNAAEAVGRGEDLGTVETGKLADLVLLDADPFADITNTTRIAAVVANGRLLEGAELSGLLPRAGDTTPAATPMP